MFEQNHNWVKMGENCRLREAQMFVCLFFARHEIVSGGIKMQIIFRSLFWFMVLGHSNLNSVFKRRSLTMTMFAISWNLGPALSLFWVVLYGTLWVCQISAFFCFRGLVLCHLSNNTLVLGPRCLWSILRTIFLELLQLRKCWGYDLLQHRGPNPEEQWTSKLVLRSKNSPRSILIPPLLDWKLMYFAGALALSYTLANITLLFSYPRIADRIKPWYDLAPQLSWGVLYLITNN